MADLENARLVPRYITGPRQAVAEVPEVLKPEGIDATLKERGSRYGQFRGHAAITQNLKEDMRHSKNWGTLNTDMKESLDMIQHKIGRILNGDPNYKDSWTDIIGYARLVEQNLKD
jgi:hypothetical protein